MDAAQKHDINQSMIERTSTTLYNLSIKFTPQVATTMVELVYKAFKPLTAGSLATKTDQ